MMYSEEKKTYLWKITKTASHLHIQYISNHISKKLITV